MLFSWRSLLLWCHLRILSSLMVSTFSLWMSKYIYFFITNCLKNWFRFVTDQILKSILHSSDFFHSADVLNSTFLHFLIIRGGILIFFWREVYGRDLINTIRLGQSFCEFVIEFFFILWFDSAYICFKQVRFQICIYFLEVNLFIAY